MDEATQKGLFNLSGVKSTRGTEGEKGTGFGLLLCKEYTDLHNGRIEVVSQVNNGSWFSVILPLKQNIKKEA